MQYSRNRERKALTNVDSPKKRLLLVIETKVFGSKRAYGGEGHLTNGMQRFNERVKEIMLLKKEVECFTLK